MSTERSLGKGQIGSTETQLYKVGQNTQAAITLMSFSNNQSTTVYFSVYKRSQAIDYLISPMNQTLPKGYMSQEDGRITLGQGDAIMAICSLNAAIDFTINGEEQSTAIGK